MNTKLFGATQGSTWSDVADVLQIDVNLLDRRGKLNLYLASQLGYLEAMVWFTFQNRSNTNFSYNSFNQSIMAGNSYFSQMNMPFTDPAYANMIQAIPPSVQANTNVDNGWNAHLQRISGFQKVAGIEDAEFWMSIISDIYVKDSVKRLLIGSRVSDDVIKKIPNRRYVSMHCIDLVMMHNFCVNGFLIKIQSMMDYQNPRDFSVALLDLGHVCTGNDVGKVIDHLIRSIDSASRFLKNNEWLQESELRREFIDDFSSELKNQALNDQAVILSFPNGNSLDEVLYRFLQNQSLRGFWVSYSNKFKKRVAARVARANERGSVKSFTARMSIELIEKFKCVENRYALTREQLLEVLVEGCHSGRINIQVEADQMRVKLRRKQAVVETVPSSVDGATATALVGQVEEGGQSFDTAS